MTGGRLDSSRQPTPRPSRCCGLNLRPRSNCRLPSLRTCGASPRVATIYLANRRSSYSMKFESRIFDEPLLEFGDQHSHPDPRLGLAEAGPLQVPLGDKICIGIVGDAKTIESTQNFLERAANGFESKSAAHPNLHPNFPGLQNRSPFRCQFSVA